MSTALHMCSCPLCNQNLEYGAEFSGQSIDCPSCRKPIILPATPFVTPPRENFIKGLFTKLRVRSETEKANRRKKEEADRNQSNLKAMLFDAVSDGVLTDIEIQQIRSFMAEAGLHESEILEWSSELFRNAVQRLDARNVTQERIRSIQHIKQFLRVPDTAVSEELERIDRFSYLLRIRQGPIPTVDAPNVILRADEAAYWVQPSLLWENRVVSRRYEGGYAGMSFRIAKGLTIRTGGSKGTLVSDTADVVVGEGNFIVTSKRLIFQGSPKSFETKYEKIIDITNHIDGIRYSESNKQRQRQIQYLSPNGDIIVEILSRVFSTP